MKRFALILAVAVGLYLTGRGVSELLLIHWNDPASYRSDWGGPSLIGVLAVHCLPGLLLPAFIVRKLQRRRGRAGAQDRAVGSG